MIMFVVMVVVGVLFNPMNILAYRIDDLYLSLTLVYGGILMATNMIWAHEIVKYYTFGGFNTGVFLVGIFLSIGVSVLLLREQLLVNDKQWMKRMISHHSTALTTSHKIYNRTQDQRVRDLAKKIIDTQEEEIKLMRSML